MKTSIRHPRRLLSHLFLFTLLLGACHELRAQSVSYFLYDNDTGAGPAPLVGSTENAAYKTRKAIEVLSFSLNGGRGPVSYTGAGPSAPSSEFNPIGFVIQNDPAALPILLTRLGTGDHFPSLVLEGATVGATTDVFFKLEMKNAVVSTLDLSGTEGNQAVYNVSFDWEAVRITTWKRKPDGTMDPNGVVATWNRKTNTSNY